MYENPPMRTIEETEIVKKPGNHQPKKSFKPGYHKVKALFRKKTVILLLSVLILFVVYLTLKPGKVSETQIPVYKVKKGNFLVSITESGEIRAKNSVSIVAPRVRGNTKIVFLVPEGTYVKAGMDVVKFDPTDAFNNLKESESKLEIALSEKEKQAASHRSQDAQMESDLKSAELTYELSKLALEQMKFEAEVKQRQAKLDHQKNELSFTKTKKDIESRKIIQQSERNRTEIELKQRRADLERAKNDLDMLTLKSPTDGLVVYESNWSNGGRKFAIGDVAYPGWPIVTLPDLSLMESTTFVNEVDISKIRKGLPVKVKLDAFPDSVFDGEIADVASLGKNKEGSPNIKIFEINVLIKGKSSILKPGMTTNNRFIIREIPGVLSIPQEAVFEKNGKKVVYVKNGSGFDEIP
ncbi:MAG: efflux RND transporter periplasmic adaptor subunit, partial [Bacillota bacterium]